MELRSSHFLGLQASKPPAQNLNSTLEWAGGLLGVAISVISRAVEMRMCSAGKRLLGFSALILCGVKGRWLFLIWCVGGVELSVYPILWGSRVTEFLS